MFNLFFRIAGVLFVFAVMGLVGCIQIGIKDDSSQSNAKRIVETFSSQDAKTWVRDSVINIQTPKPLSQVCEELTALHINEENIANLELVNTVLRRYGLPKVNNLQYESLGNIVVNEGKNGLTFTPVKKLSYKGYSINLALYDRKLSIYEIPAGFYCLGNMKSVISDIEEYTKAAGLKVQVNAEDIYLGFIADGVYSDIYPHEDDEEINRQVGIKVSKGLLLIQYMSYTYDHHKEFQDIENDPYLICMKDNSFDLRYVENDGSDELAYTEKIRELFLKDLKKSGSKAVECIKKRYNL